MKVGAHPLVVAVALGLLGPNALAESLEDEDGAAPFTPCDGCTCGAQSSPSVSADWATVTACVAPQDVAPLDVAVDEAWLALQGLAQRV